MFKARKESGQVVSYDVFVAVFVFLLLWGSVFAIWNHNTNTFNKQLRFDESKQTAFIIANQLTLTSGAPFDWNQDTVQAIGLASQKHVLSLSKLSDFNSLSDERVKELLNLKGYDYSIEIIQNATLVFSKGTPGSTDTVAVMERIADYNGAPAKVRVILYD